MTVRTLLAVVVAGVLAVLAMAAEIRPDPTRLVAQSSTTRRYRSAVTPANIATSAMRCVMKFSDATDCRRDRIPIMKSTTLCPSALAAAMTCPTSGRSHAATSN